MHLFLCRSLTIDTYLLILLYLTRVSMCIDFGLNHVDDS